MHPFRFTYTEEVGWSVSGNLPDGFRAEVDTLFRRDYDLQSFDARYWVAAHFVISRGYLVWAKPPNRLACFGALISEKDYGSREFQWDPYKVLEAAVKPQPEGGFPWRADETEGLTLPAAMTLPVAVTGFEGIEVLARRHFLTLQPAERKGLYISLAPSSDRLRVGASCAFRVLADGVRSMTELQAAIASAEPAKETAAMPDEAKPAASAVQDQAEESKALATQIRDELRGLIEHSQATASDAKRSVANIQGAVDKLATSLPALSAAVERMEKRANEAETKQPPAGGEGWRPPTKGGGLALLSWVLLLACGGALVFILLEGSKTREAVAALSRQVGDSGEETVHKRLGRVEQALQVMTQGNALPGQMKEVLNNQSNALNTLEKQLQTLQEERKREEKLWKDARQLGEDALKVFGDGVDGNLIDRAHKAAQELRASTSELKAVLQLAGNDPKLQKWQAVLQDLRDGQKKIPAIIEKMKTKSDGPSGFPKPESSSPSPQQ